MLCIEQSPHKNEVTSCTICKIVCLSGQRRRDPFGSNYCSKCGCKIQNAKVGKKNYAKRASTTRHLAIRLVPGLVYRVSIIDSAAWRLY